MAHACIAYYCKHRAKETSQSLHCRTRRQHVVAGQQRAAHRKLLHHVVVEFIPPDLALALARHEVDHLVQALGAAGHVGRLRAGSGTGAALALMRVAAGGVGGRDCDRVGGGGARGSGCCLSISLGAGNDRQACHTQPDTATPQHWTPRQRARAATPPNRSRSSTTQRVHLRSLQLHKAATSRGARCQMPVRPQARSAPWAPRPAPAY